MTNLDSILKSRYITLPTKVRLVKAIERLLLNYDTGILGPQRRRIQSGARDKACLLRALCNKVLLKYKGDRKSF